MSFWEQPGFDFASPPASRASDGETAEVAGRLPGRGVGKVRVLRVLARRGPMTDEQIASATGLDKGPAAKRRLDCQRQGWVRHHVDDDGDPVKRLTNSRSPAFVWQITDEGRALLKEIDVP